MGRRIWVSVPAHKRNAAFGSYSMPGFSYDTRVLSLQKFLPADASIGREKHLVQVNTDPGGMRTLSLGSIQLKDPKKSAAAKARHAAGR